MKSPTNRVTTLVIFTLAILTSLAGCTSYRPAPQTPDAAPPMIKVEGQSLPTISFDNLFTDIPGGRIIGYYYEGIDYTRTFANKWDESYENETKDLNYPAQEILGGAGYRVRNTGLGELRLEGTIKKLTNNTYTYKASFDQAECELDWALYRAGEEKPYFTTMTKGVGRVESAKSGAIKAAFELGLRRLIASEEFVAAVGSQK